MTTLNGFPIVRMKLMDLQKAQYNPRKISDEQKKALQKSLQEFGTVEPIVLNIKSGNVVGGHQRLDALLSIGETETDVVQIEVSEEREKALNIALNKISGDWDTSLLKDLLLELEDTMAFDLTGFSEKELEKLLPNNEKDKPAIEFTSELLEENNYVIFAFDNVLDWQVVEAALEIQRVKGLKDDKFSGGGSIVGTGRVLKGERLLEVLRQAGKC